MPRTYTLPASSFVTGPSPRRQHRLSHQALVALQRDSQLCQAAIAGSRQRGCEARDLMMVASERIVCSLHYLATSRETVGHGSGEHRP